MFENSSLYIKTQDAMSKHDFKYNFYELIGYIKGQKGLNLEENYQKNVDLLLDSLKIEKQMPDLEKLENSFKEIFLTK